MKNYLSSFNLTLSDFDAYFSSIAGSSAFGVLAAVHGQATGQVLNKDTLIPIGFYIAGIVAMCGVGWALGKVIWKTATLVKSITDQQETAERRYLALTKTVKKIEEDIENKCK